MTDPNETIGNLPDAALISRRETRRLCGGISDMTVNRWLRDPAKNFPPPIRLAANHTVWKLSEVLAWIETLPRGGGDAPRPGNKGVT